MHDCSHGSFLPWPKVNDAVGFVTGVLMLTPYSQWRREHALHHASSGDLDRRGNGDVTTITVREYLALGAGDASATACSAIRRSCSDSALCT